MKLLDKIRGFLRPEEEPEAPRAPEPPVPLKKTCKQCGKTFTVDPSWGFVPTFCKDCKQKMAKDKELAQREGPRRDIKRKCKVLHLPQRRPPLPHLLSQLPQTPPDRHEGKI